MTKEIIAPYSETDVLTVTELASRLKISKDLAYQMVRTNGCPVYNVGGDRGNRIIWGDFLRWFRTHYAQNNSA